MLIPLAPRSRTRRALTVAIVASCYNRRYVDSLLRFARRELRAAHARILQLVRVPGAFEIPAVAAALAARNPPPDVILCLGVIFQGETAHARQIGDAVSHALARLQVDRRIPVVHGVYLFDNEAQARVRCLGTRHNRGIEIGRTAVEMARVITALGRFQDAAARARVGAAPRKTSADLLRRRQQKRL